MVCVCVRVYVCVCVVEGGDIRGTTFYSCVRNVCVSLRVCVCVCVVDGGDIGGILDAMVFLCKDNHTTVAPYCSFIFYDMA